jgi:uncharacterized protein YacL
MTREFIARIVGMFIFGILGWATGVWLGGRLDAPTVRYMLTLSLAGAALGLLLTPYLIIRPVRKIRDHIRQASAQQALVGVVGLVVGLIASALLALPLSFLPAPWGKILPAAFAVLFAYLGAAIGIIRQKDLFALLSGRVSKEGAGREDDIVLLDTSVIIDGRIADVSHTGFISGTMVVPRFVLNEIQHIADSSDPLRRARGRRGLDMLNRLQKESVSPIRFADLDIEDVREVDDKLVMLAKRLRCPILTNDYNLNRVAELQGVPVLNINELANAVRAVVLPGETLSVSIIQEGKELGQGVGYLDDGTMVVIENGRRHIGQTVTVNVTKVLQTAAGRMIFAQISEGSR